MAKITPKQYEAKYPQARLNPCTKLFYYIEATDIMAMKPKPNSWSRLAKPSNTAFTTGKLKGG